jgi:hypothetical protein
LDFFPQGNDIPPLDVTAILSWMHRYPVGTSALGLDREGHRIRLHHLTPQAVIPAITGLPQRCCMVDIHSQPNPFKLCHDVVQ